MNHYEWTNAVIDNALRIEKHNRGEGGGEFSDSIHRLRTFLGKEPFIYDDGEAVYVDVEPVIRTIEANPGLDHKKITHIVMQAVVKRTRENRNGAAQRIIPMKEPDRCDDWFREIRDAVKSYEAVHCCTPNAGQLWDALKKHLPSGSREAHGKAGRRLISPDIAKPLHHKAFKDRYSRYFLNK